MTITLEQVDLNNVSVLIIGIDTLDSYKEEHNHRSEKDLSYKKAISLAKGEYSLFDMVRLMNTDPAFHTFDPESNYYIPVSHTQKDIISGGFELIN